MKNTNTTDIKPAIVSSKTRWTDDENKILIQHYRTIGTKVAEMLPGRSKSACRHQAELLGLTDKTPPSARWTEKEDAILRLYYPSMGSRVYVLLRNRTSKSCQSRAKKLKLKFY